MIRAEHISKRYKKMVLKDVSFTAEKGDLIGIIGANGCGKTTLLTIMAGVRRAGGGSLYYNNESAFSNKKVFRRYTGYVPQGNPLVDELSGRDNLKLWLKPPVKLKDFLNRDEIKRLGIADYLDVNVGRMSGGMKRRLSIAAALSLSPQVLILDEPGTALDLKGRAEIADYLAQYAAGGGTVVMTTHIEAEIELCSKLYILKDGVLTPLEKGLKMSEIAALI